MIKQTTWKKITEERFEEMLGMLPPAHQCDHGFLVGEAVTHRVCAVTGNPWTSTFAAFIGSRSLGYFECTESLTYQEYRAIDPNRIKVLENT